MTDLAQLESAASPAPWHVPRDFPESVEDQSGHMIVACATSDGEALDRGKPWPLANAALIVAMRNELPHLLSELTRYRSFVSWLDGVCVDNDWSVATDVIRPAIARLKADLAVPTEDEGPVLT